MRTIDGQANEHRPFALAGARAHYGPERTVDVLHLDLWLRPDLAARRLDAVCTLTVEAIDDGVSALDLDAVDLRVTQVLESTGAGLRFHAGARTLRVEFARELRAQERCTFAVHYTVEQPRRGLYFVGPSALHPERVPHCWTQCQDEDARYWFPCLDHPNEKQTTSATVVVPHGQFALANGRLVERRDDAAAGTSVFRYEQDVAHATYLVTMVAGTFSEIEQPARIPVYYYVPPGREADGERAFGKTPRMLEVFEQRIGVPYPYARYSQIAVADFVMGGMENTSATTQTDLTLHDERAHLDFSSDPLVAHELAHQWFGDLLTCRDWSQAWLNEGFATFFEAVFREADLGYDEYLYDVHAMVRDYFAEERSRYRRPIVTNVYRDPIELFDAHLYQKAGAVLHMLRGELGERRFWRAINRYVRDNVQRSVETIDFVRAIEHATGYNARRFADQWIYRGGHPELDAECRYDERRGVLDLTITQRQTIDEAQPAYAFGLTVGLLDEGPPAAARDFGAGPLPGERRSVLQVDRAVQTFTLSCARPGLVRLDPGAFILATWKLDLGTELHAAALRGDPDPRARIRAVAALAVDPAPAARAALEAALSADPFWGVRVEIARALGATRAPWAEALLVRTVGVQHPKVRRAVVSALGECRSEVAAAALAAPASGDPSYFVMAAALEALGKTRDPRAFEVLQRALAMPSWRNLVARGALAGFAELADERAATLLRAAAQPGNDEALRAAALHALARTAWLIEGKHPETVRLIASALEERSRIVLDGALGAAEELADARLIAPLRRLLDGSDDGRTRRRAAVAIRSIEEALRVPGQISKLRTELDELREHHRKLLDRVDRLDAP